jgi:agmatine deiminase
MRFPAEWERHERTWIAFPHAGYTLGQTESEQLAARQTWANVANAASEFEKVSCVVNPGDYQNAKRFLSSEIEIVEIEIDDAWIRDSGPSFVIENNQLQAVNWVFNGWGAQDWASYKKDARLATEVAKHLGVPVVDSRLTNEGGGFHVNGSGDVLLTKTVQLGNERNPGWPQQEVEREIHEKLGTSKAVWLERGLTRDYEDFGTLGHVDIVSCFAPDGRVLVHDQQNPNHPDHLVSSEVRERLGAAGYQVLNIPAPEAIKDSRGYVDYSYINHYVLNDAVLLCAFDEKRDRDVQSMLRDVYPDREIVLIDARELFARGGGIHCITQQQPAVY